MNQSWHEVWSFGTGASRTYCGIANTGDEFAVDVLHGYTCLETSIHTSSEDAHAAAGAAKRRYKRASTASRVARTFSRKVLYMPNRQVATAASRRRSAAAAF